jgi:hypothetical protein
LRANAQNYKVKSGEERRKEKNEVNDGEVERGGESKGDEKT